MLKETRATRRGGNPQGVRGGSTEHIVFNERTASKVPVVLHVIICHAIYVELAADFLLIQYNNWPADKCKT